jgi:hypothetical protein
LRPRLRFFTGIDHVFTPAVNLAAIESGVRSSLPNSASAIARYLQSQKNDSGVGNLVCWMALSMPSFAGIALALYTLSVYSAALPMMARRLRELFRFSSPQR